MSVILSQDTQEHGVLFQDVSALSCSRKIIMSTHRPPRVTFCRTAARGRDQRPVCAVGALGPGSACSRTSAVLQERLHVGSS